MSTTQRIDRSLVYTLGVYQTALGGALVYLLCDLWPVKGQGDIYQGAGVLFPSLHLDVRTILLVMVCGALGGLLHSIRSFAGYLGKRKLSRNFTWWYLIREPQGALLALIFYCLVQVGTITITTGVQGINFHGIAALSLLVGLFADISVAKLRDIYDYMIKAPDVNLGGKIDGNGTNNGNGTGAAAGGAAEEQKPAPAPGTTEGKTTATGGQPDPVVETT